MLDAHSDLRTYTSFIRGKPKEVGMRQENHLSGQAGPGAAHLRDALRKIKSGAADAGILARLSPPALAKWPAVARQLSDAGVLDSVGGDSVVCYCEAYARWHAAGDQLATMLIELGLTARRRTHAPADLPQAAPRPAATTELRPEPIRRASNAIIRRAEVESETGLSRSTIYQRIKAGTFPPPVRLGARSVGWRVADIDAFLVSPADYVAKAEASRSTTNP
jgi:predicted DNA-binding transcriptional regulator AlpA